MIVYNAYNELCLLFWVVRTLSMLKYGHQCQPVAQEVLSISIHPGGMLLGMAVGEHAGLVVGAVAVGSLPVAHAWK